MSIYRIKIYLKIDNFISNSYCPCAKNVDRGKWSNWSGWTGCSGCAQLSLRDRECKIPPKPPELRKTPFSAEPRFKPVIIPVCDGHEFERKPCSCKSEETIRNRTENNRENHSIQIKNIKEWFTSL